MYNSKKLVIIDTGSGVNITNDKTLLHNYEDSNRSTRFFGIGKNSSVSVKGYGYIKIKNGHNNTDNKCLLTYYVPEEESTIISCYDLAKKTKMVLSRKYTRLGNKIIKIKTKIVNGVIHVKMNELIERPSDDSKINAIKPTSSPGFKLNKRSITLEDAHKRMGHTGIQQIENSIKHNHYEESLDLIKEPNEFWCQTCKISKATKRNHYTGSMNNHSTDHEPGSSWCMDIFGPVSSSNADTKRYMLIMVDNNTRYCMTSTHFNKNAETILAQIRKNIQYVETQFDRKVREINSDRGTEFTNDQIEEYFISKGIHHILTSTQDHAANGRAERYIRTIITDATTLLRQSNLRVKFWEYAVTSATNIRNCLEHKSTGKLPLKAISRQPVTVRLMSFLPFGEKGIIWNHNHKKLKPSGLPSIILCKDPNSYGYKFFIPSKNKIVTSDNYTIPNYTMDGRVRNTQNINKSHQFSSDNDDEEDQIETVTNLCEALENYEDDNKPITRLEDLFTEEELSQIDSNAKYPSPSNNLEGDLDYVFSDVEESGDYDVESELSTTNTSISTDKNKILSNKDFNSELASTEISISGIDKKGLINTSHIDEDKYDEKVHRIPSIIQEKLVGSKNTIKINDENRISDRIRSKNIGSILNTGLSRCVDITDESITNKDESMHNAKPELIQEQFNKTNHETSFPKEGSIGTNVKFRNTNNEISLKTGDTSLPIKTLESINNHHSNDYSTNKVEKFEKENHHPPPIEDIVDMSDQTDMESNCQDGNNLKELKVTDKNVPTDNGTNVSPRLEQNIEASGSPVQTVNKSAFLNKEFSSLNMKRKRKRHDKNNSLTSYELERDKKRSKRNRVKLIPDNMETVSAPKIRAIYYNEAISKNPDLKEKHEYKQAYHKELQNLKDMKVFDVDVKYSRSEIPDNLIVPTNTIFTKKRNGIYKARIVCRGDTQSPDTYSVITTESLNHNHIKIFLMIANNRNMFMKTLDINHAFLYAKLEEEIYIPHPHDRRCVVKLNKALYGLKQSPKEWNDHLRQYLNGIGLKDNSYTPGLYQTEDKNLMIAVYVDDCVIAASNEQRLDEFINKLKSNFELKITGTLIDDVLDTDILGMDLVYNKRLGTIDLTLKSFINRMDKKYNEELKKIRKSSIPHMSTYKIDPKKDVLQMSEEEFRQGVLKLQQLLGELNYVRHKCRYDIEFAVKKVARLVNYPHERVFYMIYKIIQYLVRYKDIGIHYDRDCNKDKKVIAITDASVGSEYDAQSRIGVILWYGMNIFNVYSNKSTNRCVSSTEAELHAIYEGYADSETLKVTLKELGEGDNNDIVMITDSKPAIQGLNRSYQQPKEKFTWIKTEIIKEKIKEKSIKLLKITGKGNIADLLTKPVSASDFKRFIQVLKNKITSQDILASTDY